MNDPKQKPAHTAPSKPFTPPPSSKPSTPQQPQHQPSSPAPKHTDPKKK